MRSGRFRVARIGTAVMASVVVLSAALVAPASAAPNGTVGVTGGSSSKIELTIPDDTAAFGSNLTPDGDTSDSSDSVGVNVDPATTSTGACYEWGGSVQVRSNKSYHVLVGAAAANAKLDFLTADPGTFAACTGGEPVGTTMYATATPAGSWVTSQTKTSKRSHGFWLGLEILWTDDPSLTVGNATLTITATAAS